MESNRPAKRRKLDTPQHGPHKSSVAPQGRSVPAKHSKANAAATRDQKHSQSSPITNGVKGKERTAAHHAWLEAKAKSQALRGKRSGNVIQTEKRVNVYDEFEGAHRVEVAAQREAPTPSTPVKKQLDPLRNQKSSASTTASPSRGAATLGFFKQFHQPKAAPAEPATGRDGAIQVKANGVSAKRRNDHTGDAMAGAGDDSDSAEDQNPLQPSPIQSAAKAPWKGWAYGEKPKKTFEDEIRDLESAARVEAENEEIKQDPGQDASVHRRTKRISTSSAHVESANPKVQKHVAPSAVAKRNLDIANRKSSNRNDVVKAVNQEPGADTEIDDSDDERKVIPNGKPSNVEDVHTATPTKSRLQDRTKPAVSSTGASFSPDSLQLIQSIILERLSGKRPVRLANLDSEYTKVSNLITQTVTAGESNSMLLIGARGCGKSALVDQILRKQAQQHSDDFHVVRLNGFIHTDDKIALREIWRQLGREMELDEEESTSKNYADTLTTLLALLAHPTELGREQPDQVTKSVIFILDEFELFASHPRQTLLYNLFDIAQSRKAPIAVLGLTTRIDVAESLEKRVKSRFSHRYVHLSPPKSFASFHEACKTALTIQNDDLTREEREQLGSSTTIKQKLDNASEKEPHSRTNDWNTLIDDLLTHESFLNHLRRIYYTTKSVTDFHASMLLAVSTLLVESATTSNELLEHFLNTLSGPGLSPPDSKLTTLSSLSTLQLAILICAARLTAIHNTDVVPFAQAYEEYKVLASKAKLQASASGALAQGAGSRVWSKGVAEGAWEDLIECGLVMEDGSRGGRVDVGLEEIGMSGVELGNWGRWCREI